MSKFIPFLSYAAVRKFVGSRDVLDFSAVQSPSPPVVRYESADLFDPTSRSHGRGANRTQGSRPHGPRTSGRGASVVHTVSSFPYHLRDERTPLSDEELRQLPVAHKFSA